MESIKKNARVAGFLYLLLALAGPLRLTYIPNTLFVTGNASATAGNIAAHATLFRFGIVSDLFCGVLCLFLSLAFYQLFEQVDRKLSVLVVILGGLLPAAIDFFVVLNDAAALMLARGADFLSAFDKFQRDALVGLFLRLHHQEVAAAQIFWGLWLFPLALLVLRSGWFPRFLGYWLIANGFAYLALSLTVLLLPRYEEMVATITLPALFGEAAITLWLLIMGAKERQVAAATSSSPRLA